MSTNNSNMPANIPNQQQQTSSAEKAAAAEEQKSQQEQMLNQILSQVLDQPARARLNTIKLAKPQHGSQIEQLLMNLARTGQLRSKIGEEELIGLLERVSSSNTTSKVKFRRHRSSSSSSDDYDL